MLEDIAFKLTLMRNIQHHTYFVLGSSLSNRPVYSLNLKESKELQCQVLELLERGYIYQSMSPCVILPLLVSKNDGSWRMCINSWVVNRIIVKYIFFIPHLDDMLDQFSISNIFYKIDLNNKRHQIKIRPRDEWKTMFKM